MLPIIFGLSGTQLSQEEYAFFKENEVFGFIIFSRNIESKKQLRELTNSLIELYPNRKPFICIDQEGGRVARLKPPIGNKLYPPAKYFADKYKKAGDNSKVLQELENNYSELTQELLELGIASPLAPIADLYYQDAHDVIGDRSFGTDVTQVVELCNAAVAGIRKAGGLATIKHIPGHGRAKVDSHLELPFVTASLDELMATDFAVFKELAKNTQIDFAMTAHIVLKELDPNLPVTLSKKAIRFIKEDLGFKGLLMSDAVEMLALHKGVDTNNQTAFSANLAKVAKESLEAGCDLVLHCTGDIDQMASIVSALTPYKKFLNFNT